MYINKVSIIQVFFFISQTCNDNNTKGKYSKNVRITMLKKNEKPEQSLNERKNKVQYEEETR